jgi:hypothetical protein
MHMCLILFDNIRFYLRVENNQVGESSFQVGMTQSHSDCRNVRCTFSTQFFIKQQKNPNTVTTNAWSM